MNKKEYIKLSLDRFESTINTNLEWLFKKLYGYEYESYSFFSKEIRLLPVLENGMWDFGTGEFRNNDVDAFRHAYVSGMFVIDFNEIIAKEFGEWFINSKIASLASNLLGQANEIKGDISNQPPEEKNMDLFNNQVGRQYALKVKNGEELLDKLKNALLNNELITTINSDEENRKYAPIEPSFVFDMLNPLVVVDESETGRNQWFFDLGTKTLMSRENLVQKIESNLYENYTVATIGEIKTPKSLPDKVLTNNLG